MAHTLRKYLSCRGSALFMVLSTMTALMICCMAMYFSVVSSRSTQYATFNQQQSYQSAVSISDTLIGGLNDGSLAEFGSLLNGLTNPGDSVTTGSNGFEAFGKTNGIESTDAYDSQLGAYSVTVTRLEDETVAGTTRKTYDVVVTTSVNGVKEAYHTVVYAPAEPPVSSGPSNTQIFAGTGYVPNDNVFCYGVFDVDVFLDSPELFVKPYVVGNAMEITGDLSCGGNMTMADYLQIKADKPVTITVRDTFTFSGPSPMEFPSGKRGTVLIGHDMYITNNATFKNADVYILGDLYIKGQPGMQDSNYFVAGDVYVESNQWGGTNWVNLDHVYCNSVDITKNGNTGLNGQPKGKWDNSVAGAYLTQQEVLDQIVERTSTTSYYKWEIDDDKVGNQVDTHFARNRVTITFNDSNGADAKPVYYLNYSNIQKKMPSENTYEGRGCVIDDVTCDHINNDVNHLTVMIDTGDDPDNTFVIRVQANRDLDGDGHKETFSWLPDYDGGYIEPVILVKGRGSVVIDVPEGVTYQESDRQMTMHYGWFVLGGGEERTLPNGEIDYNAGTIPTKINMWEFYTKFIHSNCQSGDGCNYSEEDSSATCPNCGGVKKMITCNRHGDLNEYCPTCNPTLGETLKVCNDRLDKGEIDNYLNTHPSLRSKMLGGDGELVYPNTNIFIISCAESADIRLSVGLDGTAIMQNSIFGYIYAPYMTLNLTGSNAGTAGGIRLLGGATVSDYIIQSNPAVVGCWPSQMPMNAMDQEKLKEELPGAPKNWKFDVKLH